MTLRAIHDFRSTDSTVAFNDSIKDILPKAVYFGGDLTPGGRLAVTVSQFAAKSVEGLTVRNEENTLVSIPATGFVYLVGLVVKYVPRSPALITPVAIKVTDYPSYPDADFFISFGMCDLTGGNEIVTQTNLSFTRRDVSPFGNSSTEGLQQLIESSFSEGLLSQCYRDAAYDAFYDISRVQEDDTTMNFNPLLNRFESSAAAQRVTSVILTDQVLDNIAVDVTEVLVQVFSTDPNVIVRVRGKPGVPWIEGQANRRIALGTSQGRQLQVQVQVGAAQQTIKAYAIYYNRYESDVSDAGLPLPNIGAGQSAPLLLTQLSDFPNGYAGSAGKFVAVNAAMNGVEFVPKPRLAYGEGLWKAAVNLQQSFAGDHLEPDNSLDQVKIPLPTAPQIGDMVLFRPKFGTKYSERRLTLQGGNFRIMGANAAYDILTDNLIFDAQFVGGTCGWRINNTGMASTV